MNNLSFEEGLLKECAAEPLEGHHVVVFERVGRSGERFHTVLPPGTPLRSGLLGWLRPGGRHFGIAVDASAELHLDVHEHVVLADDAGRRFDLLADVYYAVADPRALAGHRNADPLGRLRERVAQTLARELARLHWNSIVYEFAAEAEAVLGRQLPALRAFAAGYGLALRTVEPSRRLPEVETAPVWESDAESARIARETRLEMERRESRRRLDDADNQHVLGGAEMDAVAQEVRDAQRIRAAGVAAGIRGIEQVAATVRTPEELRALFQGAIPAVTAPSPDTAIGAGPGVRGVPVLPPAAPGPAGALQRIVSATQCVPGFGRRLELRAALLHLAAEVLLEDLGDAAVRGRYAERAAALVASLDGLPPQEAEALAALADPAELERALRG